MAIKNQEIVELVNALTPKEKQQFKSVYGGEFDFIYLFDFLNKYKSFDSEKIIALLQKKGLSKRKITSGHLAVVKRYLKEKILESLRVQYSSKSNSFEILTRSVNTDIQIEKGLYKSAQKGINEIKESFFDTSFPLEQLMILRRESILKFYNRYQDSSIEEISSMCESRERIGREMMYEIRFANALTMLGAIQNKGSKDFSKVERYLTYEFFPNDVEGLSFGPKYLFFWTKALIAKAKDNLEVALEFFGQSIKVWLDNPKFIVAYPKMYLGTCFEYLEIFQKHGLGKPSILKDADFEDLLTRIKKAQLSDTLRLIYERLYLLNRVNALILGFEFEKILNLEKEVLKVLSKNTTISAYEKLVLSSQIAYSAFNLKKFHITIDWLEKTLTDGNINHFESPEYYSRAVMLKLLAHYELEDYRFLTYELKKNKSDLQKKGCFGIMEQNFFKMISKLIGKRYQNKKDLVLENSLEEFTRIQEQVSPFNRYNIRQMIYWINAKLKDFQISRP